MPLTLMYITNNPKIATIAQSAGVDRVWVDMEYIGKEDRQAGLNTVKSFHTVEDVVKLRPIINKSKLMVRVNPIHNAAKEYCSSFEEINNVISAGADVVMLPMFKTVGEVEKFIEYVNKRATVQLLVETKEASDNIEEILKVKGIDEIHIGLNDLHLAKKKKFMFELLVDGTVEKLANSIKSKGIKYGFGGIARVGYGMLPAEYIMGEHYRLGSTSAILSRGFCNANTVENPEEVKDIFIEGIKNIRKKEEEIKLYTKEQFELNKQIVKSKVLEIVSGMK